MRPRDLLFGDDIRDPMVQEEILREIDELRPWLVWLAPPCTLWCPFSNLNYSKQRLRALRAKDRAFLRFARKVVLRQRANGGHVALENPLRSAIWREQVLNEWMEEDDCFIVDLEMCAYGMKSKDGQEFLRKPLRLLVSDFAFVEEMAALCPGTHDHRRIQGVETSHSAAYPRAFANAVVDVMERLMVNTAYVGETGGEIVPVEEHAEEESAGARAISFKGAVSGKVAGALKRLHQNLGHPPNRELAKHLRLSGASQEMLEALQGMKCKTCEKCTRPALHPVAKPAALLDFNQAVAVDIIYLDTKESSGHLALNMVDVGSSYQVVAPLPDRKAETVCEIFLKYWVNWAGTPGRLVIDLDTAFVGSFADLTSDKAIAMRAAAGQAHWQNGIAERYGSSWKACWEKLCVAESLMDEDLEDGICAVNEARNTLRNRSGFSPRQWVFGSNGRNVPDLEDGGHELSALHAVTPEGRMARKYAIRNGARTAFFEIQSGDAIQRALSHKNRVKPKEYKPGDLVYYYRLMRTKGKKPSSMWSGPAAVIGQEGSNYWLARGGRCILAAPEHLRPAEHDEVSEVLRIKAALREVQGALQDETRDYEDARAPGNKLTDKELEDIEMEVDDLCAALESDKEASGENMEVEDKKAEKRKKALQTEQEHKRVARQLGSLDDVPVSVKQGHSDGFSSHHCANEGHVAYMMKTATTPEGWEKILEKEIPWNMIPEAERHLYVEAEEKQWREHLEFGAVRALSREESARVKSEVDPSRILPARFLYRDKNYARRKLDSSLGCKAKARLCVGGQKDPDLGVTDLEVDAPTASRHGVLLGLQLALMRGWEISIGDIRAAFLNGVEAPRQLYFRQPSRGIPGLHRDQLVEILKGVFGLSTSPKLWWIRLSQDITTIELTVEGKNYKVKQNDIDPCCFQIIREGDAHVSGLVFTHVDDLMVMVEKQLEAPFHQAVQAKFPVDEWEKNKFEYIGCEYNISPEEIKINQTAYVHARLNKVKIPPFTDEKDLVDEETKNQNRSVIGCLSWLAKQTRPDIQFMVAQSQRKQNAPTVEDVKWTNSIVDLAKKFPEKGLSLKRIKEEDLCIYGFHDAAWANVDFERETPEDQEWDTSCKKSSQLASLVLLGDRKCLKNQVGNVSIIDWKSKASSRICRSTFAGETMACGDALETCVYLRGMMLSFMSGKLVSEEVSREKIHMHLFTDCKSLYDHLHKEGVPKPPSERRLALDLAAMRMELNAEGRAQWLCKHGRDAELRPDRPRRPPLHWVPSECQLADVLTKRMNPAKWWEQISDGLLKISLQVWDQ